MVYDLYIKLIYIYFLLKVECYLLMSSLCGMNKVSLSYFTFILIPYILYLFCQRRATGVWWYNCCFLSRGNSIKTVNIKHTDHVKSNRYMPVLLSASHYISVSINISSFFLPSERKHCIFSLTVFKYLKVVAERLSGSCCLASLLFFTLSLSVGPARKNCKALLQTSLQLQ